MSNEAMADLHSALIDANEGYEKAIDEAEDNNIRTLFEQMHEHHQRAHTDLHRALLERGERADDTGTFLSVIHRTVISVRSVVAGIDKNSLSSFADGEERIAEKYEEAIEVGDGCFGGFNASAAQGSTSGDDLQNAKLRLADLRQAFFRQTAWACRRSYE